MKCIMVDLSVFGMSCEIELNTVPLHVLSFFLHSGTLYIVDLVNTNQYKV